MGSDHPERPVSYTIGLAPSQFASAARLYDEAFGSKFARAIGSRSDRLTLFESTFAGEFAVAAHVGSELVGLAGFHTPAGSLTGRIDVRVLLTRLGLLRGLRAIAVFGLYDRKPKPGELLMDGIAVDETYRGQRVGSGLLTRLVDYARGNGFETIRLDVIDTNPGARRLYERRGFVPVRTERFPVLRGILGFGASTTMELCIANATQ